MAEESSNHGCPTPHEDRPQQPLSLFAGPADMAGLSIDEKTIDRTGYSLEILTGLEQARLATQYLPLEFGDYRLIRKIGEGGMGVVYEAEQKSLGNRRLALKTIKFNGELSGGALKRFRNEVQAVAQLEHRHVVPVYHVGEESGVHFYVMKLIDGKNLRELVHSLKSAVSRRGHSTLPQQSTVMVAPHKEDSTHKSGWSKSDTLASNEMLDLVSKEGSTAHPQFVKNFVRMGIQIAKALHYVHQHGIVHRDVKPANLLLDVDGDAWLTDFGLARIRDNPALTAPGDLVGTFQYMSPEQAMGSKRVIVDHRSDIYSLGVTLYELLTLRRAYPGSSRQEVLRAIQFENPLSVRKLSPGVPPDLETIVMKAMAKDPSVRFQSAAEMAAELERFRDGKPLTIRPPSIFERFAYWARVNRQAVATLAAVLLVTFIAAIVAAGVSMHAQAQTQLALNSEREQKDEVTRQLKISDGLRLAANSSLQVDTDPTLALLLATEAAKRHPGSDANDAIMRAMDLGHEARILVGHFAPIGHVAFNHDGTKLVSSPHARLFGLSDEPAIVWDTETGEKLGELRSTRAITSSVFSPDKYRILTASSPLEALAMNDTAISTAAGGAATNGAATNGAATNGAATNGAATNGAATNGGGANDGATNDDDDPRLAASPSLWDMTNFQTLHTFKDAYLFVAHPRNFSPDGDLVVFPINGNKAATFDSVAGGRQVEFTGHEARVVFAAFNPRGDRVVTLSDDNTVRVWNASNGDEILRLDHWRTPGVEKQTREVEWVEFSPDSWRLVTGSRSHGIELWDMENGGKRINTERLPGTLGTFYGNGSLLATHGRWGSKLEIRSPYDARWIEDLQPADRLISKTVVSPDSQVVGMLDGSDMRRFLLWDLERGEMRAILGGKHLVHDLAFSPDSMFVATGSEDHNVHLWHVANGRDRSTFPSIRSGLHPVVAASPDGAFLAVGADDPAVPIGAKLDFSEAKQAFTLNGARISIPQVGDRFLATNQGRLAIHAMQDGRFLGLETTLHRNVIESAISRNGARVAAFTGGRDVTLWIPDTGRLISLPIGTTNVNTLRFSPDGDRLFALCDDGNIRVWAAEAGNLLESVSNGGRVIELAFSPDGKQFAVTTNQNEATLYDAATLERIRRFSGPDTDFDSLIFSSDGKRLLTFRARQSGSVLLWDIESGDQSSKLDVGGSVGVAVHPSQPEAIVWSSQSGSVIWRYEENERLPISDVPTSSGAYSTDGKHFYIASWVPAVYEAPRIENWPNEIEAGKVTRWRREDIQPGESVEFSTETIAKILVSDQDQVFVNSNRWNQIVNHDIQTHDPISTMPGHFGPVSRCLYTSDSKRLITTSWDGSVAIWNSADGSLVTRRDDHHSPILTAALSRDDRYLVTGARDGSCLVWDLVDGSVSEKIVVGESPIRHVAFDREAKYVLAVTSDHQAILFQRESGGTVQLDLRADSIEWAEFAPDGTAILVVPSGKTEHEHARELLVVPTNGTAVTRLRYPSSIQTSHFDPESKRIITATRDGIVSIQNARSGRLQQQLIHEAGTVYFALFDPTGEFAFVGGLHSGTIWRISDDGVRRWLTVDDMSTEPQWNHTHNPFVAGQPSRVITRRFETFQYRDWFLHPLKATENQLPRSLTEAERNRFLIDE